MAEIKVIPLSEAMKITRLKNKPFSISFVIKSGEIISIKHAQRAKLPEQFGKLEKNYFCVEDIDQPKLHPFPVFLWAIENINGFKIAI